MKTNIKALKQGGKSKKCGTNVEGELMEKDGWQEALQKLIRKEVQKINEQGEMEAIPIMPP